MLFMYVRAAVQIGNRAGDLEDAGVGAGGGAIRSAGLEVMISVQLVDIKILESFTFRRSVTACYLRVTLQIQGCVHLSLLF